MTITAFEEHDERAAQLQSEPSSPILEQQQLTGPTDIFHEMKYEMRAIKGSLPTTSSMHDRLKTSLSTNSTTSSTNPSPLLLHIPPSSVNKLPSNNARSQTSSISPLHGRLKTGLSTNRTMSSANPSSLLLHSAPSNVDKLTINTSRGQTPILSPNQPGQSTNAQRYQHSIPSSKSSGSAQADRLSNRQYEKDASKNPSRENTNARPATINPTDMESVLPERTRLRRQRRMGSQNSSDEDPIERLNKLRARISGALSEVKGVLNKYSTETEPKDDEPQKDENKTTPPLETQEKSAPVQFRFVKKVRRRSVFNEDDEIKSNITNENQDIKEINQELKNIAGPNKNHGDNKDLRETSGEISKEIGGTYQKPNEMITKFTQSPSKMDETKINLSTGKLIVSEKLEAKDTFEVENVNASSDSLTEKLKNKNKLTFETENKKRRVSIGTVKDVQNQLNPQDIKIQRRPSDSAVVKKFSTDLAKPETISDKGFKKIPKTIQKEKEEIKSDILKIKTIPPTEVKETNQKASARTLDIDSINDDAVLKKPQDVYGSSNAISQFGQPKFGKRLSIKKSDSVRRSSIAAVEMSKIEPPITDEWKTQRRPSDSGTIIKNAKITIPKDTKKNTETNIKRSPVLHSSSTEKIPLIVKNDDVSKNDIENKCKDDAMTPSAADKQKSMMMPIRSIKVIEETSLPSSPPASAAAPLSSSLVTAIGRATTALANAIGTVISPSAKKTKISDATNDLKFPLISDGREIVNVAVPLNLSQKHESSSQKALSDSNPTVLKTNEISIISLENVISPSTSNAEIKNYPKRKQEALTSPSEQFAEPLKAASSTLTSNINHIATTTDSQRIHQEKIPQTIKTTSSPSSLSPSWPSLSSLLSDQPSAQQVAVNSSEHTDDIRVYDRVPEIIETTSKKSLSEVNVATSSKIAAIPQLSSTNDVATKAIVSLVSPDSGYESIAAASASSTEEASTEPNLKGETQENMPELQVLPTPFKAHEIQQQKDSEEKTPFCESKDAFPKKKIILKKVSRKSGNEKLHAPKTINDDNEAPATKILAENETLNEINETTETTETLHSTENENENENDQQLTTAATLLPKERKVKKKVIIKRLQRRLSGSEQTFFINSCDEKPPPEVETIEKAIAYVTDDEIDDMENNVEFNTPKQPLKSCVHLREYQVGDWVMYAERYKKTQIRWKKGRIIERITSISYKVDIDGKEVSTHIKDLKKYTGRKVRFGNKEYLEIDYEQINVEEVKTRTYSIWNMV